MRRACIVLALAACDPDAVATARVEACVNACSGESPSPTDRETCKLVCDAAPADATLGRTATARLGACESACARARSTDGSTCRLNCVEAVTQTLGDQPRRPCHRGCLEQLDRCALTCTSENHRSDRATCDLVCEEQASHCVDACAAPTVE